MIKPGTIYKWQRTAFALVTGASENGLYPCMVIGDYGKEYPGEYLIQGAYYLKGSELKRRAALDEFRDAYRKAVTSFANKIVEAENQ